MAAQDTPEPPNPRDTSLERLIIHISLKHGGDAEGTVEELIQGFRKYYPFFKTDPLYPHVIHFGEDENSAVAVLMKTRESERIAQFEVEALSHWASQNNVHFEYPAFSFPLLRIGNRILFPYIGPEVYEVINQLNTRISEVASRQQGECSDEINDLLNLRRAFVLRQIDILVRYVTDPYIPQGEDGTPIVENSDVVGTYIDNMQTVITSTEKFPLEHKNSLELALTVFPEIFQSGLVQRYADTYTRNILFRVPHRQIGQISGANLDSILEMRQESHQQQQGNSSLFARDMAFLEGRLLQCDLHRCEKIALSGECLANIIHDPRLLDSEGFRFDEKEQINAFARYLLLLAYHEEFSKGLDHNKERLHTLFEQIKRTETGSYTLDELREHVSLDDATYAHYLAMSFYKSIRWFGYIRDSYLPRYDEVLKGRTLRGKQAIHREVAEYRRTLYRKDQIIQRQVARNSLSALMDVLYQQLPPVQLSQKHVPKGQSVKGIVLNGNRDANHRTPYYAQQTLEGLYTFFYGRPRKDERGFKIIGTDSFFHHHMEQFAKRVTNPQEHPEEKLYSQLLRLAYLQTLLP